ncbi:MAG: TIGR03767 family metallophosphoesterase [Candidatus Nanopelagicales bacterium]
MEVSVAGLTRRAFMASTAALAAAFAVPRDALGAVLAAPLKPADVPTTLQQTITIGAPVYNQFRKLTTGPGEAYVPRYDILGKVADPARANTRRSLMYLGHYTDIHMIDAQSPARLDVMNGQSMSLWAGCIHPQDTMQMNVLASMTAAMNAANLSPLTGAPMTAAVNTGDSADQHSQLELDWYMGILDGGTFTPNSGKAGEYEGVQLWENTWAWHPEDPSKDAFGSYGFPKIPGLLNAAVSQTITSPGLSVPWYAVFGNHDTLINGVIPIDSGLRSLATGDRKAAEYPVLAEVYLRGMAQDGSVFNRFTNNAWTQHGVDPRLMTVTADGERKLFEQLDFISTHLNSPATPGPVGHGFTQDNLNTGQTYWSADLNSVFRVFGLDTCNQTAGADGAVPEDQFNWLKAGLAQAQQDNKLAIVLSHHNSVTLENAAEPVFGGQGLIHAEEFISMLNEYPNMVAWVNGHTHINTIRPHSNGKGGGFWEITSASCVDYPQQQQLLEFIDNKDGTMSIFATTLDHASPAKWTEGDLSPEGLGSLSRELAANDWIENPPMRIGSDLDRNTELLLPVPFDLSQITDAQIEADQAKSRAQIAAFSQKQVR